MHSRSCSLLPRPATFQVAGDLLAVKISSLGGEMADLKVNSIALYSTEVPPFHKPCPFQASPPISPGIPKAHNSTPPCLTQNQKASFWFSSIFIANALVMPAFTPFFCLDLVLAGQLLEFLIFFQATGLQRRGGTKMDMKGLLLVAISRLPLLLFPSSSV